MRLAVVFVFVVAAMLAVTDYVSAGTQRANNDAIRCKKAKPSKTCSNDQAVAAYRYDWPSDECETFAVCEISSSENTFKTFDECYSVCNKARVSEGSRGGAYSLSGGASGDV